MTTSPVMTVTDELLAEIEDAARNATPQHLDSAEEIIKADSSAMIECPVCCGEGYASLENDYCNFDNHAIGVQFYGIGPEFGAAEEYYRRANPATISALTTELRRLRADNAELAKRSSEAYEIGIYGKAYDLPSKRRAYTYDEQPDNVGAYKLAKALVATGRDSHGDGIDQGLSLLHRLQEAGFGVFELEKQEAL